MFLQKITIANFKSYQEQEIVFSDKMNVLYGANGAGKTNLIEAIYYLSMAKSVAGLKDDQQINKEKDFFRIKATILSNQENYELVCAFNDKKKKLLINDQQVNKASDWIGRFPMVFISPSDTHLVEGRSDSRRKFFDLIFSQQDKEYLTVLMEYNYFLKQRNALLKETFNKKYIDKDLIQTYDVKLIEKGKFLHQKRKEMIADFLPFLLKYYQLLNQSEEISLIYKSDFEEEDLLLRYQNQLEKDLIYKTTTFGIHRDDFIFYLNDENIKKFGSQGQQKSYIIALKLAHVEFISFYKKIKPTLLLDDIFDKLDQERSSYLIELIQSDQIGQIFITDAKGDHTNSIYQKIKSSKSFFFVEKKENESSVRKIL